MDTKIRKQLIQYLESFLTEERKILLHKVLESRTRYITVVVEDLYQTQNISAVLRSCECVGIQDVHIVEGENDFQIHKAIAMGADKWLTIKHYENEKNPMLKSIKDLKTKGYSVVATVPDENCSFLDELSFETPTAFLFGTELTGLSKEAIEAADKTVKIPMYGFTNSFNISNSVAIIVSISIEKLRKTNIRWQLTEVEMEELLFDWVQKSLNKPELLIKRYLANIKC
ncbi:MAG: RNA methyltransferase [Bacteroidales bacterium]|jgi:tRNA (guanosine-2'-O-)-methyltransferase|nr:RNA methyltransferase [Bacteroidales bacterium]